MGKYDTVVFDLDGTLLDTLEDLQGSTNRALTAYGCPPRTIGEVRRFVGNGLLRLMQQAVPGGESHPDFWQLFADFKADYAQHCNDRTKPYPGVMALLEKLQKEGYKMAIVSNKGDFAVKTLRDIYFEDVISIAIGEKEGVRKKPAPDTVFEALKELGSVPERSVYVGDSEVDVATAANAGMDCILVTWGFRDKEELTEKGGRLFIDRAEELPDLI